MSPLGPVLLAAVIAVSGCTTAVQPALPAAEPGGQPQSSLAGPPQPQEPAPSTGNRAQYADFTPEAFSAAQAAGKTSYLYFYAAWCPICISHDPTVADAIASGPAGSGFDASKVAAFRVNYDVRGPAHDLCQPPYQHFACVVKGSEVVFKTGSPQPKAEIIATIQRFL